MEMEISIIVGQVAFDVPAGRQMAVIGIQPCGGPNGRFVQRIPRLPSRIDAQASFTIERSKKVIDARGLRHPVAIVIPKYHSGRHDRLDLRKCVYAIYLYLVDGIELRNRQNDFEPGICIPNELEPIGREMVKENIQLGNIALRGHHDSVPFFSNASRCDFNPVRSGEQPGLMTRGV